jgi:hypothetical protein
MKPLNMIMYNSKYNAQLKIANNYHIILRVKAHRQIDVPTLQIFIWELIK